MSVTRCLLGPSVLLLGLALHACERPRHDGTAMTPEPLEALEVKLGEPFELARSTCQVDEARTLLTEPLTDDELRRVPPDVHVLGLRIVCEEPDGKRARLDEALPQDLVILLERPGQSALAPSTRRFAHLDPSDALAFELETPSGPGVRPQRQYAADTCARKAHRAPEEATLLLRRRQHEIRVGLTRRFETPAFEAALDLALGALCLDGADHASSEALREARALHRDMVGRFGYRTLHVEHIAAKEGTYTVALRYAQPKTRAMRAQAMLTLRLSAQHDAGRFRLVWSALERAEALHKALRCERELDALSSKVAQAYAARSQPTPDCNVLSVLLPGPCSALDPALAEPVLKSAASCLDAQELERAPRPLPEEFQLTLRRGRSGSALDRNPRYTVSIFGNGALVFHGQHWVSARGRSDGRTSRALIERLYAYMLDLDWFDRRGGAWSREECDLKDERGNVITLHTSQGARMVVDRDGCRGPFAAEELERLGVLIDMVAGVSGWTSPRPRNADPGVHIWTVE
jgi:hypothetical protein